MNVIMIACGDTTVKNSGGAATKSIHVQSHSNLTILGYEGGSSILLDSVAHITAYALSYPGTMNSNSGVVNFISTGNPTQVASTPSVSSSVTNSSGANVQVIIQIGSTATRVSKTSGGSSIPITGSLTASTVTVNLCEGESIQLSNTTNVTWTWWIA